MGSRLQDWLTSSPRSVWPGPISCPSAASLQGRSLCVVRSAEAPVTGTRQQGVMARAQHCPRPECQLEWAWKQALSCQAFSSDPSPDRHLDCETLKRRSQLAHAWTPDLKLRCSKQVSRPGHTIET